MGCTVSFFCTIISLVSLHGTFVWRLTVESTHKEIEFAARQALATVNGDAFASNITRHIGHEKYCQICQFLVLAHAPVLRA